MDDKKKQQDQEMENTEDQKGGEASYQEEDFQEEDFSDITEDETDVLGEQGEEETS
jgi:hypothetical protein